MDVKRFAQQTLQRMQPPEEQDRVQVFFDMLRVCRAVVPEKLRIDDAERQRLDDHEQFFRRRHEAVQRRLDAGEHVYSYERCDKALQATLDEREVYTAKRAFWEALCAFWDAPDETAQQQADEQVKTALERNPDILKKFFLMLDDGDPLNDAPEYLTYLRVFWYKDGKNVVTGLPWGHWSNHAHS